VQSDRQLAERMGVYPCDLTQMRKGKRAVSPAVVGALCDMLELDGPEAREWLARCVIEQAPPEKQEVMRRGFFVYSAASTSAIVGLGAALLAGIPQPAEARSTSGADASIVSGTDARPTMRPLDIPRIVARTVYTLWQVAHRCLTRLLSFEPGHWPRLA
jgi:hypothetical protein